MRSSPRNTSAARATKLDSVRFLLWTSALMLGLYALLFHSYTKDSLPGQLLLEYLRFVASASATLLGWLGESVRVEETTVMGRFSYEVVLDCAALDAQALFAAAVLAFPVGFVPKLIGLGGGLAAIGLVNVLRLVSLYFAGARSVPLFQVLHEEVFVLLVIVIVCALFVGWARWALRRQVYPSTIGPLASRAG